jgi:hypothetical protein
MNIDEILERAEKVEGEESNELLSAFKVRYVDSNMTFSFQEGEG